MALCGCGRPLSGGGGGQGRQGRSHKEACVCPMIGHGVGGGVCSRDGQIAGWYKGNEGGEELARCGGARWVGLARWGGAAFSFFKSHAVAVTGRYLTKSLGHATLGLYLVYTSLPLYLFTAQLSAPCSPHSSCHGIQWRCFILKLQSTLLLALATVDCFFGLRAVGSAFRVL